MSRKRQKRFILPPALRRPWLKFTWLFFALCPWLRIKRQKCGYPAVHEDKTKDPICGKPAPFSFYCSAHQQPIWKRLAFWSRS